MEEAGWRFLIGILSALGGGGLAWLVRGAAREDMRQIFAAKSEVVSPEKLAEQFDRRDAERLERETETMKHWEAVLDKVEHRIKEKFHSEINSLGLKLTRENEHLQQQLNVFAKGVDQALRQSTDADRRSIETRGAMETLSTRLDGIEKNWDTRLSHMSAMLDLLTRKNIA